MLPGNYINVFIHGYDTDTDNIEKSIKELRLGGTTYLFKWDSYCPYNDFLRKRNHFLSTVKKAEIIGENFKEYINKIYPRQKRPILNLFAHSLGARIIHEALYYNEWKDVRLQNVVLLDGAADTNYWAACTKEVAGRIFNCYSGMSEAFILKMIAEGKICKQVGHGPLRVSSSNIKNINCEDIEHCEHWEDLPYVLSESIFSVPENRKLISQRECQCPYCFEQLSIDFQGGITVEDCETCSLKFKYDGADVYYHPQKLECHCGWTFYSFKDSNPPKPGDYFSCEHCGEHWIVPEEEEA